MGADGDTDRDKDADQQRHRGVQQLRRIALHALESSSAWRPGRRPRGLLRYVLAADADPPDPGAPSPPVLAGFTDWVLAHTRLVAVAWLAAVGAGAASASSATHALSQRSSLPGKPGFEANQLIGRLYGNGGSEPPFVAVLTLPPGQRIDTPATRAAIASAMRAVQASIPGTRIASYASTGNAQFLSSDRRTTFALIYPPSHASRQTPIHPPLPHPKPAPPHP